MKRFGAGRAVSLGIQRMLVLLLLVIIVPSLIYEVATHYVRLADRENEAYRANMELSRSVAATFDTYVQDVLHLEKAMGAAITNDSDPAGAEAASVLQASATEYPSVLSFNWVSPQARVVAASDAKAIGMDVSDRPFIQEILRGQDWVVSDLFQGYLTNSPGFAIARGIRDQDEALKGIIVAFIDPTSLGKVVALNRSAGGALVILDRQGMLVYRYPELVNRPWDQRNLLKSQPIIAQPLAGLEVSSTVVSPDGKQTRLASYTPIRSFGWVASTSDLKESVVGPAIADFQRELALYIAVAGAGLVAALYLGRRITIPLKRLSRQAAVVGRGEFGSQVDVTGPGELKELGQAFNLMMTEISTREDKLAQAAEAERASHAEAESARLQVSQILESITDGFFAVDNDWRVTYLNEQAGRLLARINLSPEELIGQNLWEKLPIRPASNFYIEMHRAARDRVVVEFEAYWKAVGMWIAVKAYPSADGMAMYARDVTRSRQAELALRDSEERYRGLAEAARDAIYMVDREGRLLYLNTHAAQQFGRRPEDLVGRLHSDLFPPDVANRHRQAVDSVFATGLPSYVEAKTPFPDREIWLGTQMAPIRDEAGAVASVLGISRDITERKLTEQLREEYVHIISHDLRAPLTVILAHAALIQRDPSQIERVRKSSEAVVSGSWQMNAMIQDLADSARLEAGQLDLTLAAVDLKEMVPRLVDGMGVIGGPVSITLDVPEDLPCVRADAGRLERIIVNLLSNAKKYSHPGDDVLIKCTLQGDTVVTAVVDHGVGMPADVVPRVFDRFYRASLKSDGIGLGLYITKMLVEAHGGRIWVASRLDEGSTFYFTLPVY